MTRKRVVSSKRQPSSKKASKQVVAKSAEKKRAAQPPDAREHTRLIPNPGTVTVRMYRIGHGDAFLIAFPGNSPEGPVYVLIDCGYKPGSPKHINTSIQDISASLRAATGGHIDIAVITHEHQDHVNGITTKTFDGITIGEAWFAWTEDPNDDLANDLRRKYKDKLLGLLAARNHLSAAGDLESVRRVDWLLEFDLGGNDEAFDPAAAMLGAAAAGGTSMNKRSMQIIKDRAASGCRYLRPHGRPLPIPGAESIRAFVLGPPRDEELLKSLDPQGREEFHSLGAGARSVGGFFAAAAQALDAGQRPRAPFARRYALAWEEARADGDYSGFFDQHYGHDAGVQHAAAGPFEAPPNAEWRRIDRDWLYSAELLALDMNDQTNNSSLVLAFELGVGGKVLLFAADAQRGNWISWSREEWTDGATNITARELLSRTVLYKVGHHGSHNATLDGAATDAHTNLSWIARGDYGREFTAMITAVRSWAETQKGWDHPLKAIKDALLKKSSGRVFQTDTDFEAMTPHPGTSAAEWQAFKQRVRADPLFFDYEVPM